MKPMLNIFLQLYQNQSPYQPSIKSPGSNDADVLGLQALLALTNLEFDLLAIDE